MARTERTERPTIFGVNRRFANANKSSMLQENDPDPARMCERNKGMCGILQRWEIKPNPSRITPAVVSGRIYTRYIFLQAGGRFSISSFVLITQRSVHARRHAGSRQLLTALCTYWLCLLCRALVGAYLLCCFVQG